MNLFALMFLLTLTGNFILEKLFAHLLGENFEIFGHEISKQ